MRRFFKSNFLMVTLILFTTPGCLLLPQALSGPPQVETRYDRFTRTQKIESGKIFIESSIACSVYMTATMRVIEGQPKSSVSFLVRAYGDGCARRYGYMSALDFIADGDVARVRLSPSLSNYHDMDGTLGLDEFEKLASSANVEARLGDMEFHPPAEMRTNFARMVTKKQQVATGPAREWWGRYD